jgi:RNA polymerase sigma-70 factor (ECF subfamily)
MIDLEPALFEKRRRFLLGLAYRILGSLAEAEDAVQDTFLRWREADKDAIESPAAWLTATCTRRCIDVLRSAHRTRVEYVGTWLSEPVYTMSEYTPDDSLELASSLSTAFLLLLERLTPKERAARQARAPGRRRAPRVMTPLSPAPEATQRERATP